VFTTWFELGATEVISVITTMCQIYVSVDLTEVNVLQVSLTKFGVYADHVTTPRPDVYVNVTKVQ
jgi:hypothetical protein